MLSETKNLNAQKLWFSESVNSTSHFLRFPISILFEMFICGIHSILAFCSFVCLFVDKNDS